MCKPASPRYFEDVFKGEVFAFPSVTITATMRQAHVALYGEDWPTPPLPYPLQQRVVPAPLIISLVAGQMGRSNFLRVKYMRDFSIQCHHPIFIDHTITTRNLVEETRPHEDVTKDHGYVIIEQVVSNQEGSLCCVRRICYLVYRRASRCVV